MIIGGPLYIAKLTNRVASAANVSYHARIVAQKYIQRELIRISSEIQNRAFDESIDVNDLLDFSEQELFQIAEGNIKKETVKINVLIQAAIEQIQEAGKKEGSLLGVPSGFTKLDILPGSFNFAAHRRHNAHASYYDTPHVHGFIRVCGRTASIVERS